MKKKQSSFEGVGGLKIFYRSWVPETIKGVMLIVHGLGEHSGRYDHVAERLEKSGWACFALDHRGHGQSEGKRGHILSFKDYVTDTRALKSKLREDFTEYPIMVLGHSMGGLIAAHLCLDHPRAIEGLILSSPALTIEVNEPAIKLAAGRFFSKVLPGLTMSNGLDPAMVSHDPAVVKDYIEDPLVHDRVSARWFTEFTGAMDEVMARAADLRIPFLLMQSGEDKLVDPSGAGVFFEKVGSKDKTLKIWEGYYHEMFNEIADDREPVFALVEQWLSKHVSG